MFFTKNVEFLKKYDVLQTKKKLHKLRRKIKGYKWRRKIEGYKRGYNRGVSGYWHPWGSSHMSHCTVSMRSLPRVGYNTVNKRELLSKNCMKSDFRLHHKQAAGAISRPKTRQSETSRHQEPLSISRHPQQCDEIGRNRWHWNDTHALKTCQTTEMEKSSKKKKCFN